MKNKVQSLRFFGSALLTFPALVYGGNKMINEHCEKKVVGSILASKMNHVEMAGAVRISSGDAVKVATNIHPGTVVSVGLEKEDGYLVYAVEIIQKDATLLEVMLDAGNGKILSEQVRSEKSTYDQKGHTEEDVN